MKLNGKTLHQEIDATVKKMYKLVDKYLKHDKQAHFELRQAIGVVERCSEKAQYLLNQVVIKI